jgi:hypothetical protein
VLHASGVRAPSALVVLRQLDVVTLAVHPNNDVADAAPGVEPAVDRGEDGHWLCVAQGGEAKSGVEESAASV